MSYFTSYGEHKQVTTKCSSFICMWLLGIQLQESSVFFVKVSELEQSWLGLEEQEVTFQAMFSSPPLPFSVLKVLLLLLHLQVRDDCNYLSADVRENSVLQESASTVGWHVNIDDMISGVGREKLLQNTEEALNRGSFGVPRLVNTSTDVSCWLSMFFLFSTLSYSCYFPKKRLSMSL